MMLGVVVLAGGEGRRIGGNKPERLLGAKSLLAHVLDQVAKWDTPAAIAIGLHMQVPNLPGFDILRDEAPLGPISGIGSALRWARDEVFDAVLTVPCDTPFLPHDLPSKLGVPVEGGARAAIACSNSQKHPSCGLWKEGCLANLERYLSDGRSLMGFAREVGAIPVAWPVDQIDPFFNVNTLEDLALAEEFLRSR